MLFIRASLILIHKLIRIGLFQKLDAHPLKKTWESKKFYPYLIEIDKVLMTSCYILFPL